MHGHEVQLCYHTGEKAVTESLVLPKEQTLATTLTKKFEITNTTYQYLAVVTVDNNLGTPNHSPKPSTDDLSLNTKIYTGNLMNLSTRHIQKIFILPRDIINYFPLDQWNAFNSALFVRDNECKFYLGVINEYVRLKKAKQPSACKISLSNVFQF